MDGDDNKRNENTGQEIGFFLSFWLVRKIMVSLLGMLRGKENCKNLQNCSLPGWRTFKDLKKKCGGAPSGSMEESHSGWNLVLG